MSPYIIYVLYHETSRQAYIGSSARGLKRPREHAQAKIGPVARWIEKLKRRGRTFKIGILEELSSQTQLHEAERFHMDCARAFGAKLLNAHPATGSTILGRPAADNSLRQKIIAAIDKHGLDYVTVNTGFSEGALGRAVIGARMRRGTMFLLEQKLNTLEER